MWGRDIDLSQADWDTLHLFLYNEEHVPSYSTDPAAAEELEARLREDGRFADYCAALARLGADLRTATPGQRSRAAVEVAVERPAESGA